MTIDVTLRAESGLDLLKWIRARFPQVITVLVTAGSQANAHTDVDAMFLGADALLIKPEGSNAGPQLRAELSRVLVARQARRPSTRPPLSSVRSPAIIEPAEREVIVVGASTGGPIVQMFLERIPKSLTTPILIVQHMPAFHVPFYAELLAEKSGRKVVVAQHGQPVSPGVTLVAGEAKHMRLSRSGGALHVSAR